MVVDCGGGTVDITVHEMENESAGNLRELYKAAGGPHGSIGINSVFAFWAFLLWSPYVIGQTITFLPCGFYLLLSFFPRLISAATDWMSTILLHMAWP